jgi:hypothetical protein
MWPIHLAFFLFVVCRIFLSSVTLCTIYYTLKQRHNLEERFSYLSITFAMLSFSTLAICLRFSRTTSDICRMPQCLLKCLDSRLSFPNLYAWGYVTEFAQSFGKRLQCSK